MNSCSVCDKFFDSEILLKEHLAAHSDESILNKPIESSPEINISSNFKPREINLKEIFSDKKFEELIESKINGIEDNAEYLDRRYFIEQIKKINHRNPFCYVPYFIEDLISGFNGIDMQKKYHIWYRPDFEYIVKEIFQFKEKRYSSSKFENAFEYNLKNIDWEKKYLDIVDNCRFFKNELNKLIFHNALQSQILVLLMQSPLEKNMIYKKCFDEKEHYTLFKFMTNTIQIVFSKFLESNLNEQIDEILFELKKQNIILRSTTDAKNLSVRFPIDEIKKYILRLLKHDNTIVYSSLRRTVNEYFPGLRLIPGFGAFTAAWKELFEEKIIHIEYRSARKNDMVFFLNSNFQEIENTIQSFNPSQIPFKGRKITPDIFVSELLELEKGDFDDEDDQVTRLAGLVLAESMTLQPTPESIPEFDFTIDMNNYDFRDEQEEAMKKLHFIVKSTIFHVKIMVNEILDIKKYKNLLEKIPKNEQGIVISFKKLPLTVKKLLEKDHTLQIIDEGGVKIWVSITSVLPSRVNSICKIYFDPLSKLKNKLVKINSVFYEKGIALVTVFPELAEVTVLARSLEEIPLFELNPSNFNLISKNYSEFLKILTNCTLKDDLINGFFKNKFTEDPKYSNPVFKLKFDYNIVNLNLTCHEKRDIFNCDCMKYAENPLHLCSHLVTALDYVFRTYSYGDTFCNDSNRMKRGLENLLRENIEIVLDRLDVTEEQGSVKDEHRVMDFISGTIKTENNS
jgi:hypothetical protein